MSTYWKYKNLSIFAYGKKANTAGPSWRFEQARSDWDRWATSGEICPIYINGIQLSILREDKGFDTEKDLQTFFKQYFPKQTPEEQETLVNQSCAHFHQAGLLFATNFCVKNIQHGEIRALDPITKIDLVVTDDGWLIKEQQTYKGLVSSLGIKDEITKPDEFHAQTTTTYLLNQDGIQLLDLEIDCPSHNASSIFDTRSVWKKICQYIMNMLIDYNYIQEKSSEPISIESESAPNTGNSP
ncbi:hypothetical protein [Legionella tunisiensis]|uniref:hypothetical protein n=1 Tax=Legionella tunisiensis TaxID=1034944 RepID=UPI0002EFB169|nr:hypothetical protein [Legionella tunisiensis]